MTTTAYNNSPELKARIIAQLEADAAADRIVKGTYWARGKGCAVGCTLHAYKLAGHKVRSFSEHAVYDKIFGPGGEILGGMEDLIFERLPNELAMAWPIRFASAIRPGADLSRVGWHFIHWVLTSVRIIPKLDYSNFLHRVDQGAQIAALKMEGQPVEMISVDAFCAAERIVWSTRAQNVPTIADRLIELLEAV